MSLIIMHNSYILAIIWLPPPKIKCHLEYPYFSNKNSNLDGRGSEVLYEEGYMVKSSIFYVSVLANIFKIADTIGNT